MPLRAARSVRRFLAFRRLCAKLALRYGRLDGYTDAQIEAAARAARARMVVKDAKIVLTSKPSKSSAAARLAFAERNLHGRYPFDARDVVNAFAPRLFYRFDFPNRRSAYTGTSTL
jgi:hypothetical protein